MDSYSHSAWKRPWSSYGSPAYAVRNSPRPLISSQTAGTWWL